jgi:O-antigen chain-terminating methyltransferase
LVEEVEEGMPPNDEEIAVADVLQRLQEEVRQQRQRPQADRRGTGTPQSGDKLYTALEEIHATRTVNPHLPIAWPKWPPGVWPKIVAVTKKVVRRLLRWYINPIVEQQNAFNAAVTRVLEEFGRNAQAQARLMQNERTESETRLAQLRSEWEANSNRQQEEQEIIHLRLQRLERKLQQVSQPSPPSLKTENPLQRTSPLDYFHLGLKYRGPNYLREQQEIYLDYFRGCQNVLDIGCGRGEFVGLLQGNGIGAQGIDLDADAVAQAREGGLPVEQAEALAYLAGLPDHSLDGVFMAQVVEHLTSLDLLHLLDLCCRKMKPGAYLVAETINPTCLWALANWYLIDPSHVRPVHPETLKFLLEGAGFWKVQFRFLTPVPPQDRLMSLPADAEASPQEQERIRRLNCDIERLNTVLFGYQDYAAIAERPPEEVRTVSDEC